MPVPKPNHTTASITILESITDGFVFYDINNVIQYWNKQAELLIGLSREETIGKNIWSCFPEEVGRGFYAHYAKAMQEQETVHFEEYLERIDRWLEVTAYPSNEGISIYFKDITERKSKEQELEEVKLRFNYVLKATNEAISDYDLVNQKAYWHGANFKTLFGYDLVDKEAPKGSWRDKVHPDDLGRTEDEFQRALENGSEIFTCTYRFKKANGEYAVVKDRSSIIRDKEGAAIRVISAMEDITEQKKVETVLTENEKKYRSLFNNAPLPQWIYDAETLQILDVNEATIWHYGYSRPELLKMTVADLRPESEKEEFLKAVKDKTSHSQWGIWKHQKKNGAIIKVEVRGTTVDYNGTVARLATINDITEKDAWEKALQQSEENYKSLFRDAPLPQYICEVDTLKIVKVNKAAVNLYGYSEEEFLQMTPYHLRSAEEHEAVSGLHQIFKENREPQKVVSNHIKKNGEKIVAEVHGVAIDYQNCSCVLVTITDITNEVNLEERLSELKVSTQKNLTKAQIKAQEKERETIGKELHDNINQQLTTVKLYMDLAKERGDLRLSLIEKSETVLNNAINEIRTLSKSLIPPVLKDVGLMQALEELIDSFRLAQKFQIHFSYNPLLDKMDDDIKVCFYRVVQEQLTNITKYAEAHNAWIDFEVNQETVYLTINDDGKGFDPGKRRSGVGISNIKNRIELFNGVVLIESKLGNGCTLQVMLPYHLEQPEDRVVRLLVAEDSSDDRHFLETTFKKVAPSAQLHFEENGMKLLDYLQTLSDDVLPDLIVMDYNMPLLNGLDALQALNLDQRFNRIPKIIYSTSTNKKYKQKSLAASAAAYIEKGATPDEVADNVRQMLSFAQRQ